MSDEAASSDSEFAKVIAKMDEANKQLEQLYHRLGRADSVRSHFIEDVLQREKEHLLFLKKKGSAAL